MSDPVATAFATPLFLAAVGTAGLCLSLLAELFIPRLLPQLTGAPTGAARLTTAAAGFALSALFAWRFGPTPELAAYLVLVAVGVQLARIDAVHHLLPNRLVLPLLAAATVLLASATVLDGSAENLFRGVAGAVTMFVLYLFLALTSRNSLGMGDVKLAAPLGLYLGYLGWSQIFYGASLGFVAGGLASAFFLLKNRGNRPKEVAHGPSMLAACFTVILLVP